MSQAYAGGCGQRQASAAGERLRGRSGNCGRRTGLHFRREDSVGEPQPLRQPHRSPSQLAAFVRSLVGLALLVAQAAAAQSGGSGTIYYGHYGRSILVLDERTMRVVDTIPVTVGIPLIFGMSEDRKRFYVGEPHNEHIEIIDIASKRQLDRFTLSEGNKRVRISGFNVDPEQRFAIMVIKVTTRQPDRFEIGPPRLVKFDLATKTVTDTIPWPEGQERDGARIIFSPDGKLMYFFADEILVFDTETLKQVDRWNYSTALDYGMGSFGFGFQRDFYEAPGFYTGVFRVTDPINRRTMMGVATVNLAERTVDWYTIGPSSPTGFVLSPDRKRAYGLRQEVGNWEFWTFDLERRTVLNKITFAGRPRMRLSVSSNGRLLYISGAGHTIEIHDARTFRRLRTVEIGADVTSMIHVPPSR
jgi:DNA-binding beta-propeller fold protein YncE